MLKKFKIALHWQILFAIVLAVLYGITFPNLHSFSFESYEKFAKTADKNNIDIVIIKNAEKLVNIKAISGDEFLSNISENERIVLTKKQREIILSSSVYNPPISYVSWMGDLFLRALKMIIIPLILTSIISGIANIGSAGNLGRLGLKTMLYYLSTSTLAILAGLFFVNLLKPGLGNNIIKYTESEDLGLLSNSFSDTLMNIVPENIFRSFVQQDMLSIIFFAILFGFFITKIENKSQNFLRNFFNSTYEVMMKITMFIIIFTPLGVFGIIAKTVADHAGQLLILLQGLGLYSLTVLLGLAFHALVVLPLIVKFVGKSNPYKHFKSMRAALLTAFSTSSSAATLSLTIESVENKSGVSNKVAGFTLPLGATINMDGTALYECIAAIFVAQVYGFDLTITEQFIIVVTALLASIGAAAIPMAGMVMLSVVLAAVDLPLAGIALILPVDRILDMFRTAINVWSDSCGAVVIAKTEGENLKI